MPAIDESAAPDQRVRLAVCICTYRRPEVLDQLLEALVGIAADVASLATVTVVVVDDDAAASAESTVDARRGDFTDVVYAVTGSGNISTARNRAMDEGSKVADLLAVVDDDCIPHGDWLRQLLLVQRRYGADIVSGACVDVPPDDAPRWFTAQGFATATPPADEGAPLEVGALKNSLFSTAALRRAEVRFDDAYGRTGGEDSMFFYTAAAKGLSHVFAPAAVVEERVPLDRTTFRYQFRRAVWYGNTEATTSIASGRYGRARIAVSSAKRLAAAGVAPFGRVVRRRPAHWRQATCLVASGWGRLLGAFGVRLDH